jgi:transcriptional regulator with XRE-family HTH domain
MTAKDDEGDRGKAHFVLRSVKGYRQDEVARAARTTQGAISRLEQGEAGSSLAKLERLAGAMGYAPGAGRRTVEFLQSLRADAAAWELRPSTAPSLRLFAGTAFDRALDLARGAEALLSAKRHANTAEPTPALCDIAAERRKAVELWARLAPYPHTVKRAVVLEGRQFHDWALCELVCAESAKAAPDSADDALALAELAVLIAGLVEGEAGWRTRLEGYSGAHAANALRVGRGPKAAGQRFADALRLWERGAASDPGILDAVRMLDLEASLRKDERRLGEALALLDRALATRPDQAAAGRLLMNKASTLEKLGRNEEALAVLADAAPLVEGAGRERLRFGVRFGVVVNLCELGRHAEAEPLLAEVREMAVGLGLKLYLRRLRWLEGRVAGGLGRTEEAIATLTGVKDEFADQGIAYDAALATLELAVLLLDHGRTAEVKRLAEQSKKIFDAQGVAREALATLNLFRQAVAREAMTAALARRLMEDLRGTAKVPI